MHLLRGLSQLSSLTLCVHDEASLRSTTGLAPLQQLTVLTVEGHLQPADTAHTLLQVRPAAN